MNKLEKNILTAKNPKYNPVNCIGTALFITDMLPKDMYVNTNKVYKSHLKNLVESKNPLKGYLVSWETKKRIFGRKIIHLAVITHLNPLLITHRTKYDGPLMVDDPFIEVKESYKKGEAKIRFYIPENNHSP